MTGNVNWTLLFLITLAILALTINVRVTYVLLTDQYMTRPQRLATGAVVWLLPIVGGLLLLALVERRVVPRTNTHLAADEINPSSSKSCSRLPREKCVPRSE
jgi:uncharacterized oligopeptide transporter (OPT) family protein